MIEPRHLVLEVIRPVLKDLNLWSVPAEQLLLGTACVESDCGRWLVQNGGPALGIYQMEPATHDDCWQNYLEFNGELATKIYNWGQEYNPDGQIMIGNLYYATAMARIKYLRDPEPIPDYRGGQAQMWKRVYNTELGAGTVQGYLDAWNRFVTPTLAKELWTEEKVV